MKIDYVIGYVGRWTIMKTMDGAFVAQLSLSNWERENSPEFKTDSECAAWCLEQVKGFEEYKPIIK